MRKLKEKRMKEAYEEIPTENGLQEWFKNKVINNSGNSLSSVSWSIVDDAQKALANAIDHQIDKGDFYFNNDELTDRELEEFQKNGDYSDIVSLDLDRDIIDEAIDNYAIDDQTDLMNWFTTEDKGRNHRYVTLAIEDYGKTDVLDAIEFGNRLAIEEIMRELTRDIFDFAILSSNNWL